MALSGLYLLPICVTANDTAGTYAASEEEKTVVTTAEDSLIYVRTMEKLLPLAGKLGPGELMVKVAESFFGTPYKGGTLESRPERLIVNLRETDCILLVETCTAMTVLLRESDGTVPPFSRFCGMLRSMRYRNGTVDGYASRLHYTSEWMLQNQRAGILQEITGEYGEPLSQKFSFMSSHRDLYPAMKDDPEALERIRKAELALDTATAYFQIPAAEIPSKEQYIRDGDIVCFVSATRGLDLTHVGIACHGRDGKLHFIHASMKEGKVVLESRTLAEYCRTGIRVARLTE